MADIFDQAAGKQAAPAGDIFDQAATPRKASEMLPHPEAVDQVVTAAARAYVVHGMEQLGGVPPGPAAPPQLPVPWETDLQFNNPSANGDIPQQLLNTMFEGAGRAAQGVEHMAAPGGRAKAGGLHQVISGGFDLATPAVMAGGVTAPIKTAITVGAAMAAQKGTTVGLKYLGLPEEYADVAGDLVGLVAGAVAHGKVSRTAIRGEVEPLLKERAAKKATVPKQEYTITGQPVGGAGDIFDKAAGAEQPAAEAPKNKEYFRGDWNIPMNAKGRDQVAVSAGLNANQFDEIHSGTKDRHVETAGTYAAANPEATQAKPNPAFDPMHMGIHEGAEVTPGRLDRVNDHIRLRPDEPIPGVGWFSGSPGEAPRAWSSRLIGAVQDVVGGWKPGEKKLIVTSGRDVQAVRAWVAKGMPADRAVDPDVLTARWETQPGEMMRLDPRTGKTENVDHAGEEGIYFARHGETDGNDNSAVPAEIRSKIRSEAGGGRAARQPVDARAARPVDTGRAGEGGQVHGPAAPDTGRPSGEETDVLIPGEDRAIRARYEVWELGDLQPSHHGQTFLPNERYGLKNERDYSKPENQQRVIENSSEEKFNPRYHVTDNPDATNGPVLINEQGDAVGGNNRSMILQRVYGRDGRGAAGYRALLEKKAAQFGLDADQVRGMKQPVLVRVASNAELESLPGGSKWAIRKTNIPGVAALSDSERAAADAGQLSPEMVEHIAGAIEAGGPDATLNDALKGKSGTAIVNRLIADGFFSEQERPGLMDGKTGALTQAAKDRISKALLGQFFRNADQIARTPASVRNKLERMAAPLAKVQGNPEWDLTPAVREAIDLLEYAGAHGIKNLGDVVAQEGMFGDEQPWHSDAIKLAELLRDAKPNELVAAVRRYVNDQNPNPLFGDTTPANAFREHFGGEKAERTNANTPDDSGGTPGSGGADVGGKGPGAGGRGGEVGPAEKAPEEPLPPKASKEDPGVYFGSGLGVLEPLFREAKAEGDALRAKRKAALDAIEAAKESKEQKKAGQNLRAYFTAERDLWAARANQALDIVSRKVVPKIQTREAIGIMREFRHRPQELQAFIDGTHPFLQEVDGGAARAMVNLDEMMPLMKQALRMMLDPTRMEEKADRLYTNIAQKSLDEGRKGGWLESRWQPDEYVPHLLHKMGEGEVATMPSTAGRLQGKVGKYFGFSERRLDKYPTMVHAVADGLIPKTLDPSAAFTVHADKFAQARATHLLQAQLADLGMGKWGDGAHVPEGWVQLAAHTDEFKQRYGFEDPQSGTIQVGTLGLYVPPFIDKALSSITDPDFSAKRPGFARLRNAQRVLKEAILGLSGFHLLTENVMAKADVGPTGMYRSFQAERESVGFLMDERDLIGHGGTTSIQGSTVDAYRQLRPGTIPTRGEVLRGYIAGSKRLLDVADDITRLTFDNVQRRFKVVSFALHRDAWMKGNPLATPEQTAEAKRGIASYVNGVYGGLHWENMGWSQVMVESARAVLLAPDWSGSNIALAKYATDDVAFRGNGVWGVLRGAGSLVGKTLRELPRNAAGMEPRMKGLVTKETVQARLARAFWTKQLTQGLVENQMLSLLFSGQLSRRPFQVYQGKDREGNDIFQNVVFRGSAGDAISLATKMQDAGILEGVGAFGASKAAPVTKLGMHILTGRDDMGRQISPRELGWTAKTVRGFGTAAADVAPVPIVLRQIQKQIVGDELGKYVWSERIMSLFGPQAQHVPPDGMRMTSHGLVQKQPKAERSTWEQIVTGKR